MNVMMVHDTPSKEMVMHPHNKYHRVILKGKKVTLPIILLLFDLGVKGQMNVLMVRDTPSYGHTFTYQISLTYL